MDFYERTLSLLNNGKKGKLSTRTQCFSRLEKHDPKRVQKDSKKPGEGVSTLRGKVEKKKERSWRVTVSGMKGYFQNLYITSFLIYKLL